MKKRTILCTMGLVAAAGLQAQEAQQPNVVFILADDMGSADFGFLGSPIETPNLDRLRAEGMYLHRSYVQPQSSPSRVAFITGCYPYRYGMHEHIVNAWSEHGVPGSCKTIAEKMKECGYQTAMVGKWHIGGKRESFLPQNQGFDETFIAVEGHMDYWNYQHQGKFTVMENGKKVYPENRKSGEKSGNMHATALFGHKAEELIKARDKDKPLFMYLAFTCPHTPLQPPATNLEKYKDSPVDPYWSGETAKKNRKENVRKNYMGMVDHVDEVIGHLLQTMEQEGMMDNTLIVFCSDNGGTPEADNRPLRSYKGDSFEGGIRSTTLVRYPKMIQANSTSEELFYISDWYPTLAELAGFDCKDEHIDGISGLNILKGKKGQRKAVPIISSARHAYVTPQYTLVGNDGDYGRVLDTGMSSFKLYDVIHDEGQQTPLYNEKVKARLVKEFMPYFGKVERGFFNWEFRYRNHAADTLKGDHTYDFTINDEPTVKVEGRKLTISPVSKQNIYNIIGYDRHNNPVLLERYACAAGADRYVYDIPAGYTDVHVDLDFRHGFPIHETFTIGSPWKAGTFNTDEDSVKKAELAPQIEGFLPYVDMIHSQNISIVKGNLDAASPKDGMLCVRKKSTIQDKSFVTSYFCRPFYKGKVYLSVLARLTTLETECTGKINFLVQNDTQTKVAYSVALEPEAVYSQDKFVQAYEAGDVVKLVFELDLRSVNQDVLKLYINPEGKSLGKPADVLKGEFSFDRLQYMVDGRESVQLYIDDLKIGLEAADVL